MYYRDWEHVYAEERQRGDHDGPIRDKVTNGRPGIRGEPQRPDRSTRPDSRRRYARRAAPQPDGPISAWTLIGINRKGQKVFGLK